MGTGNQYYLYIQFQNMCLPFLEWFVALGWTFLQLDHVHNAVRHCREKPTPKNQSSEFVVEYQHPIIISCPSSMARTAQAQTSPFAQTQRHASSRCCTQESMFCEQLDHDLQVLCPDGSKGWTGGVAFLFPLESKVNGMFKPIDWNMKGWIS